MFRTLLSVINSKALRRTPTLMSIAILVSLQSSGPVRIPTNPDLKSKVRTVVTEPDPSAQAWISQAYERLPLSFEANQGQTNGQVKFLSRGRGYSLFLTPTEAALALRKDEGGRIKDEGNVNSSSSLIPHPSSFIPAPAPAKAILRMKLIGANPAPRVVGLEELPGRVNYFIGNDPKQWRTNIPTYAKVKYEAVYPGVDLVYYGHQRQLEYDFIVAAGADPKAITMSFEGVDTLEVDAQGELVLQTQRSRGQVRLHKPVVYQEVGGLKREIVCSYVLKDRYQVGFGVSPYDAARPLVIDPVLSYSTYLGGSNMDSGNAIAVDAGGNAYVAGETSSDDFPTTPEVFQTTLSGIRNTFVTKLDPEGSRLIYSTYLGGSSDDVSSGIKVDAEGNAYVTGVTASTDFPTTLDAFQTTFGGQIDAFMAKLNPEGSALVYSTYLGGRGRDIGNAIALDAKGNAYVTGWTASDDFPTTPEAFQTTISNSSFHAFVTKLDPEGSTLVYSTYLGGRNQDFGYAITLDAKGNAYVTGQTSSTDFPTTPEAFQTTSGGGSSDAFVTKLSPEGSALVYSTYLSGRRFDGGLGIALDADGNAYVTGWTASDNFPTTSRAFQTTFGGDRDAFVTKLSPEGSALVYSTYLGGRSQDAGVSIALDADGNAYVAGLTESDNFPTTPDAFQRVHGGGTCIEYPRPRHPCPDVFVTKLDPEGAKLVYSTYLGGRGDDKGFGIALDADGNAYVTGWTASDNFPTTPGALQTILGGDRNAFTAKIGP